MKDEDKKKIENDLINDEFIPAPIAIVKDLDLNWKKLNINFSKIFFYVKGDIITMYVDIIVNSSSSSMKPQMGVSTSIHNKYGPELLRYLK